MSNRIKKTGPGKFTINGKPVVITHIGWRSNATLTDAEKAAFGEFVNSLTPIDLTV